MSDLIERLRNGETGYSISCEVGDFLGAAKRYQHPGSQEQSHKNYTTNLQDAVDLVPDDLEDYQIYSWKAVDGNQYTRVELNNDGGMDHPDAESGTVKGNPAAALCIAVLEYKQANRLTE